MAALSVTTVALSLSDGCPGLPFYILEIIINTSLILEVAIRFVAFGGVSATTTLVELHIDSICAAILEVTFQRIRSDSHRLLCLDLTGSRIRRLWGHQ